MQASPHISLRDVPDVIHIFDVALVLHSSNSDGFFTHFGGDILLDFDAQFFEDQVPCRGSGERKFIRVVFPEPRPSSDFKPSPELSKDMVILEGTHADCKETAHWLHQAARMAEFHEENTWVNGKAHRQDLPKWTGT